MLKYIVHNAGLTMLKFVSLEDLLKEFGESENDVMNQVNSPRLLSEDTHTTTYTQPKFRDFGVGIIRMEKDIQQYFSKWSHTQKQESITWEPVTEQIPGPILLPHAN